MYLIIKDNQLLGYTYEKLALAAFMQVCKRHGVTVSYKECPEDVLMKKGIVKTKEHIEHLVTWYSQQPEHTIWYHHYIRLNTNLIPQISWEFRKEVHKAYYELFLKDLTEDLCDLIDAYNQQPKYNGRGWYNGVPISSRAKRKQRFYEGQKRRYGFKR
jgi:hypothetical protein